jgi:tetratricopeptide (TPR) repeat protein
MSVFLPPGDAMLPRVTVVLLGPFLLFTQVCVMRASADGQAQSVNQILARAEASYTQGNWKAAAEEYGQVVKLAPKNVVAYVRLGVAYQKLGMPEKAETAFQHAMSFDPTLPEVDVLLALSYIGLHKYQDAIPLLDKAVDKKSYDLPVRLVAGERLAEIYFRLEQDDEGLAVVLRLQKLAPDNPDVLYIASKAYATIWKNTVARMLKKDPNSYRVHQVLADVAEAQGRFADAAKEYRLIIKMEPQLPGFHYQLGRMILLADKTPAAKQEALAEFQKELEINRRDAPTYAEIGDIYLSRHDLKNAAQGFSSAINLQPSNVEARIGMGKVLLEQKDYASAAEQFEKAAEIDPTDEKAYYSLMLAYRNLGRMGEAKRASDKFNELSERKSREHSVMMQQLTAPLSEAAGPNSP